MLKDFYDSYLEEFRYEYGDIYSPMSFEDWKKFYEIADDATEEILKEIFY